MGIKTTRISELPEHIKVLAELRRSEHRSFMEDEDDDDLLFAFDWNLTPEGAYAWNNVDDGDYSDFDHLLTTKTT